MTTAQIHGRHTRPVGFDGLVARVATEMLRWANRHADRDGARGELSAETVELLRSATESVRRETAMLQLVRIGL
jgi:hypothetical protein